MVVISFLSAVSFSTYIFLGLRYFFLDKNSPANRNFLYFCLSFALWSMSYVFIAAIEDPGIHDLWVRIGYIGALSYEVSILRFFLMHTGIYRKIRCPRLFTLLIWIVPLVFIYMNLVHNAVQRDFPTGFWYVGLHVFANIYNVSSIGVILFWVYTTPFKRERHQGKIIAGGGLLTIAVTLFSDFFFGLLGLPTITPILILIWIGALYFATVRYQFMGITPELIAHDVLAEIDDYVAVFDRKGELLTRNASFISTCAPADYPKAEGLFYGPERMQEAFDLLLSGQEERVARRLFLKGRNGKKIPIHARLSLIRDRFGDDLGILLVGREVRGLETLRTRYELTEREIEIIVELTDGRANRVLAEKLNISANTLKAHVTNIYNKVGINSKLELVNCLKELNIDV